MSCKPGVARQGGVGLVLAALLLAFSAIFAGTAVAGPPDKQPDTTLNDHPSGKDRTEEPGRSGAQGKSASDPDGMANGGADKPGGDGGFDDDQDGNNGCGNDDDFEDDNKGNCGGVRAQGTTTQTKTESTTTTQSTTTTTTPVTTDTTETAVQGVAFERPAQEAKVLGVTLTRTEAAAAPAALAATGAPTTELLVVASVLIASGMALVAGARRRETALA